jgi:hypothetical protein
MKVQLSSLGFACVAVFAAALFMGSALHARPQQQEGGGIETHDGGTREVLESIAVPPKAGAPFTLKLDTEWVKPLADGDTVTVVNERTIARDSSGRIYQQRVLLEPKSASGEHHWLVNVIQIMDPAEHTLYNCWMLPRDKRTCDLLDYKGSTTAAYAPAHVVTGPLPGGRGTAQHEDLGGQSVAGMETQGSRDMTTINPGVSGNEHEMIFERETWYSAELGINLISVVKTPNAGKQTFRVTEVTPSEPNPVLFVLPEGFKVVDRRESTDSQRAQ